MERKGNARFGRGRWARGQRLAAAVVFSTIPGLWQGCGSDPVTDADVDDGTDTGASCRVTGCTGGLVCLNDVCLPPGTCIDNDSDGYGEGCELGEDCDDTFASVNPGRPEVCDDEDNDCDFSIDEDGVCSVCTPSCTPGEALCTGEDVIRCDDSSGCARYGTPEPCAAGSFCQQGACVERCVDADNDGVGVRCEGARDDCNDANPTVYQGASELCDGLDNNCDTRTDENFVCDTGTCVNQCEPGAPECLSGAAGVVQCVESPDGCFRPRASACPAGQACTAGACSATAVCTDRDRDGRGPGCAPGADCRPLDPNAYAGATEVCDGIDNDCDGVADDGGICGSCTEAPLSAPLSLSASGVLYRVACGGPEYVAVDGVGSGQRLVALVAGASGTTLAVGLPGASFAPLTTGAQAGGFVQVQHVATTGGRHLIRVVAPAGTPYALSTAIEDGSCEPDALEPSNSPVSPAPVGSGTFMARAGLCTNDYDFYAVEAPRGAVLSAALTSQAVDGGLLLSIWRNGIDVTPSFGAAPGATGELQARAAHLRLDLPGEYVVGVRGFTTATARNYALGIRTIAAPACTDDALETAGGLDNDTVATARTVASRSVTGTLCPGDYDVYAVGRLTEGANIDGTFTAPAGLQVALLLNGWEAVRVFPSRISTTGEYYLVVYGSDPTSSGNYTLNWR